jgi:hypothetical protein
MKEKQALEQPFLDRANALTNVAEVFRCSQVTILICDMLRLEFVPRPRFSRWAGAYFGTGGDSKRIGGHGQGACTLR